MSNKKTLIQFKENCLNNELFLSEFYRKYQSTHKKKEFKINEFLIEKFNTQVFLMFTSDLKEISYFGLPVELHIKNQLNLELKFDIINNFLKSQTKPINKYVFSINLDTEISKDILRKINPKLIFEQQSINLDNSNDYIFKNFKSNLRYEINKTNKNEDIKVKIINKKNYPKNFILEMMETHKTVSGRQTRSMETWLINEQMILQNQAFISVVYYKSKAVSYSLFFYNNYMLYYFSSVTLREYFNISGISHASIWEAICYAKKIQIKKFNMGLTDYLHVRNDVDISNKEKNIAFFKSRYCGEKKYKIIIDENSFLVTKKFK